MSVRISVLWMIALVWSSVGLFGGADLVLASCTDKDCIVASSVQTTLVDGAVYEKPQGMCAYSCDPYGGPMTYTVPKETIRVRGANQGPADVPDCYYCAGKDSIKDYPQAGPSFPNLNAALIEVDRLKCLGGYGCDMVTE